MNQRSRIYLPYIQYIENIEKFDENSAKQLMLKIAEFCLEIIDIDGQLSKHENRFKDIDMKMENEKLLDPIARAKNKIEMMIQLAFLVNKCTKPRSIKPKEKIKSKNKDEISQLFANMNSKDEKDRNGAIKKLSQYEIDEFEEYYTFSELEHRKQLLYNIKHRLLSEIIKELGKHPELYADYIYGFIRDNEAYVFAINIPGHLGTYQFHIQPTDEKEILYNIDCIEVQHEYEQLAEGNEDQGKMDLICTKDEISDLEKVKKTLSMLKAKANKMQRIKSSNDENILRKIFLYSILLEKDPREQLYEANRTLAFEFINEKEYGLQEFYRPRTVEDERRYNMIIANLKKFKRIFISSPNTIDSKVAVEAIRRKCIELGLEECELDFIDNKPRS